MIDLTKTIQYRLYTYDVWGNQNDGWTVNNTFKSVWWLPRDIKDDEKMTKYIEDIVGVEIEIDQNCSDDNVIYFSTEQGEPVCELRLE